MKTPLRVLVVEDSEFDAKMLIRLLDRGGYATTHERVETADAMAAALTNREWDIVLSDYNLPGFNATLALQLLLATKLDLPFIIVSGGIGEDIAVAAMKSGASDYLMKGNLARLVPAVERELRDAADRAARRRAERTAGERAALPPPLGNRPRRHPAAGREEQHSLREPGSAKRLRLRACGISRQESRAAPAG